MILSLEVLPQLTKGFCIFGGIMERIRNILLFFAAMAAVFILPCAAYQAFNEKIGSLSPRSI